MSYRQSVCKLPPHTKSKGTKTRGKREDLTDLVLHRGNRRAREDNLDPLQETHATNGLGERGADGQVAHLLRLEGQENYERKYHRLQGGEGAEAGQSDWWGEG